MIFELKTMGRKDASTARTPVDQYRKQIGKISEEKFVCLKKDLFCAARLSWFNEMYYFFSKALCCLQVMQSNACSRKIIFICCCLKHSAKPFT